MTALEPTEYHGAITWLGFVPHRNEENYIEGVALTEMTLGFGGMEGEVHSGLTRPSCSRVLKQYKRNTEIRNVRQLSVVSAEELSEIAATLGLDAIDPAWMGASVVIAGIPDFSHVPPSSRLQSARGCTLTVDMMNLPCQFPARTIETARPGHGKAFKSAAAGKRGVTAWVEREGVLRLGDPVRLHVPTQRPWSVA